ncbi:MAG: S8/S53 family peptidase [Acidobacteriaceae bacterium]|nr:S8/S53 family peptidase [Acidobacteriaceae bacterium]
METKLVNYRQKRNSFLPCANLFKTIYTLAVMVLLMSPVSLLWATSSGQLIVRNTPTFVQQAKKLGPEDASMVIEVTVWLNLHNRAELDGLAQSLYNPTSGHYRQWLKRSDFSAKFAPTAQEAATVQQFLATHNLQVSKVGPDNMFVNARGTIANIQNAFHVQINRYLVNGNVQRANSSDPYIAGSAASLVRTVSGLDDMQFVHPLVTRPTNLPSPKTALQTRAESMSADPNFFTSHCFTGPKTETFTTGGTYPTATYNGNGYYSPPNEPGCGYTPPEIQTAYNLTSLYKEGFDGTGQTIVIIDACGSPSILDDANGFATNFGLPPLTAANFSVIEYPPAQCAGPNDEINLDVEWAHAIAPGAKIVLLIAGSGYTSQIDEAEYFAAISGLGNVISGSYGLPEFFLSLAELENENLLNEIAAVFGVAANFASGDYGDYSVIFGPTSVSAPADSPYATAVGGVSVALNANNTVAFQTGWGNNATILRDAGYLYDPPFASGFRGSGGGESAVFPKPPYQNSLPGTQRQLPDISWLADPFTGGVILITQPGQFPPQAWYAVGGTSLACPMFSALWAIANQEAGLPLGQAAPYLYSMPASAITDVVPVTSANNVTGTIKESSTTTSQSSAASLAQPLDGTTKFYSFLWDYPWIEDTTFVATLGTDSSLTITPGWDNVTGLGTPNAKSFADYFSLIGIP